MKKLLSIFLALALLAIPFSLAAAATDAPICPEDDNAIVCECDEATVPDDEDDRNWWQRLIDTVMPYLTDLRNVATRITPIIAMVVAIINLIRMFT